VGIREPKRKAKFPFFLKKGKRKNRKKEEKIPFLWIILIGKIRKLVETKAFYSV